MTDDLPEQLRVRREKLDRLRAAGVDPYPLGFPRTTTTDVLREQYAALDVDTATGDRAAIAGRVMLSRTGGKLCFATIRDGGGDIQAMISLDRVGEESPDAWKRDVDLGDHVGVEGEVITSRRGELSSSPMIKLPAGIKIAGALSLPMKPCLLRVLNM